MKVSTFEPKGGSSPAMHTYLVLIVYPHVLTLEAVIT